MPRLPETKWHRAWILSDLPPASRREQLRAKRNTWRVAGDSGNEKVHAFCPTCGTPVYLTFVAMPELIAVHATSLDDPGQFNPQVVTYGIRGHAWDTMDSSLQKFERMPPG